MNFRVKQWRGAIHLPDYGGVALHHLSRLDGLNACCGNVHYDVAIGQCGRPCIYTLGVEA